MNKIARAVKKACIYFTAYTLDEIDVKTRALRSSVNFNTTDDASAVEVSVGSFFLQIG